MATQGNGSDQNFEGMENIPDNQGQVPHDLSDQLNNAQETVRNTNEVTSNISGDSTPDMPNSGKSFSESAELPEEFSQSNKDQLDQMFNEMDSSDSPQFNDALDNVDATDNAGAVSNESNMGMNQDQGAHSSDVSENPNAMNDLFNESSNSAHSPNSDASASTADPVGGSAPRTSTQGNTPSNEGTGSAHNSNDSGNADPGDNAHATSGNNADNAHDASSPSGIQEGNHSDTQSDPSQVGSQSHSGHQSPDSVTPSSQNNGSSPSPNPKNNTPNNPREGNRKNPSGNDAPLSDDNPTPPSPFAAHSPSSENGTSSGVPGTSGLGKAPVAGAAAGAGALGAGAAKAGSDMSASGGAGGDIPGIDSASATSGSSSTPMDASSGALPDGMKGMPEGDSGMSPFGKKMDSGSGNSGAGEGNPPSSGSVNQPGSGSGDAGAGAGEASPPSSGAGKAPSSNAGDAGSNVPSPFDANANAASGDAAPPSSGAAHPPSPFSEAKNALGDGGSGVTPVPRSPFGKPGSKLGKSIGSGASANNAAIVGSAFGAGAVAGAAASSASAATTGATTSSSFSLMGIIGSLIGLILSAILAITLGTALFTSQRSAQMSTQQTSAGEICSMDSEGEAFKSGVRGVPEGEYSRPVKIPPNSLTSAFGPRDGEMHKGADYAGEGDNSPIYSFDDGVVTHSGTASGFGYWVVIHHPTKKDGDIVTVYGHMPSSSIKVKVGDEVKAGEHIAGQGNEGASRGTHLHFEIHKSASWNPGSAVDPDPWVQKATNPGDVNNSLEDRSKKDKDKKEAPEESKASAGERIFTVEPSTGNMVEQARTVQGRIENEHDKNVNQNGGFLKNQNRQRVLLIVSEEHNYKNKNSDDFVDYARKNLGQDTKVIFVKAYYDDNGAEVYHQGKWEGNKFIPGAKQISDAEGGYSAKDKDGRTIEQIIKEEGMSFGRIVVDVGDSKRYKPDPMPYNPDPPNYQKSLGRTYEKPEGYVPSPDNWVNEGWWLVSESTDSEGNTTTSRRWMDNPHYVDTAYLQYPQQHDKGAAGEASSANYPQGMSHWTDVPAKEIDGIIGALDEINRDPHKADARLYFVNGAGEYGTKDQNPKPWKEEVAKDNLPEVQKQIKDKTGSVNAVLQDRVDKAKERAKNDSDKTNDGDTRYNVIAWSDIVYKKDPYSELGKQEDNPKSSHTAVAEDSMQKYIDMIRYALENNGRLLPNDYVEGEKVKAGNKELPGNQYNSPYTQGNGSRGKVKGYEGGYKINNEPKEKKKRDNNGKKAPISGENGLTIDGMMLAQAIQEEFPEVQAIGGWRQDNYPGHPDGRAVDAMIPDYKTTAGKQLGDEINEYFLKNAEFFNLDYNIWRQWLEPAQNNKESRYVMEDRGSDTQNHFDHVHIETKAPARKHDKFGGQTMAKDSEYYGPYPGRDGSPASASKGSGFSTCCPSTGSSTGNSESGNFTAEGNVIDPEGASRENANLIYAVGKKLEMTDNEILIALMVAAGESNYLNYANDGKNFNQSGSSGVSAEILRESLQPKYKYDAVGHDAASVGIFQQQVGYWGKVDDLMQPAYQTGQFFAEMKNKHAGSPDPYGKEDLGLAGNIIQVNATGRAAYDKHQGTAEAILEANKRKQEKELIPDEETAAERGFKNRRQGGAQEDGKGIGSASGKDGESPDVNSKNTTKDVDRALNGGCGTSSSVRRHNNVEYSGEIAKIIVDAARDQIGLPYSWGGGSMEGPKAPGWGPDANVVGFDCSSLVMFAAGKAGITMPRMTDDQEAWGNHVGGGLAEAKPGDLIYWPGHTAVYIGDNKIIHAPLSGEKIKEAPVFDVGKIRAVVRLTEDDKGRDPYDMNKGKPKKE